MDHKLKYPECAPKYKDFGGGKKYEFEKKIVDDIPHVPDSEKTKMLEGVDIDREHMNLDRLNNKNDKLMGSLNNQTNATLESLDDTLFASGNKTYRNAADPYSRSGGLGNTGGHKPNYKEAFF